MGENPYVRDRSNPYYLLPGMTDRITHPDHPATVSWQDAMEFIEKLNQREGTTSYRLPTEAEWECAARCR
ncbi:formylglycine-generating enzyme family protein [Klebsiella pneumoniae]|uniref:formylglycine-generating enzyme family protein n=1 Tax=Klebsiella pneumoniae TaxID=573 RepID=UPI0035C8C6EF